ncbi:hypothetical protein AV530_007504 [Patagioenas fasciata monilis]|uniref:Uncharacterized protein n=1 Tax=Patagioenas fasciata monilis TaxID=372326 RepID=A0A1V4JY97_PATFA|nr:hypothetical protein AV530_007504 [Patagioenas fasciata monilis]
MDFQLNFVIDGNKSNEPDTQYKMDLKLCSPKHKQESTKKSKKAGETVADSSPRLGTYKHQDETPKFCFEAPKEHKIPEDLDNVLENKVMKTASDQYYTSTAAVEIRCLDGANEEGIISKSVSSHSDLIPGVYDGGLKIWECTFDLIDYSEAKTVYQ